jgi:hypothetical protein
MSPHKHDLTYDCVTGNCFCVYDFKALMDPKIFPGGSIEKLVEVFLKEANKNPVESELILPTHAEVVEASTQTYLENKLKQFRHRWDFVGPRARRIARHPQDRFNVLVDSQWEVQGCIKPVFDAFVVATVRRIWAIALNRAIFFRDPATWIFETGVSQSAGLLDFNVPISMDDPAAAKKVISDLKTRFSAGRLARIPDHDSYNTWEDIDCDLRNSLKRIMRVEDVPGHIREAIREEEVVDVQSLEAPSFATQEGTQAPAEPGLVTQSDDSEEDYLDIIVTTAKFNSPRSKGDIANDSHIFGSGVGSKSPENSSKRQLEPDLEEVSGSPNKITKYFDTVNSRQSDAVHDDDDDDKTAERSEGTYSV